MVLHRLRAPTMPVPLDFAAIRRELDVPGPFADEVVTAADAVVRQAPAQDPGRDATDLAFVTIDPPGARDLDQAVHVARRGSGWRVHYAIADLGRWIEPGGTLDDAARRRTQTYYAPDRNVPLHPPALGEDAASLLPDGDRPAVLWTIDVDSDGSVVDTAVERATVRSRAQLTYAEVQTALDAGDPPPAVRDLPALGAALLADARRRDAVDLGLPEQEVVPDGDGHWTIRLRNDLPIESWNAQISLLTGRVAARLMLDGGTGVLRTLPEPDPDRLPRLRAAAANLGVEWRPEDHPGDVLARLDTSRPRHAAFADLAAELLRGAGYTAFSGEPPDDPGHAGVGGPYAHVTAPLRRLVDRFATEVCLALAAGDGVPAWLGEALPLLPDLMADGDRRAKALDRTIIDATEAFVLSDRVGDTFPASVVETGQGGGTVVLDDPAVRGRCDGEDLPLGGAIRVRCTLADVADRRVRFERAT